jgi:hypothetical protein
LEVEHVLGCPELASDLADIADRLLTPFAPLELKMLEWFQVQALEPGTTYSKP